MPWINCKEVADEIMDEAKELIEESKTKPSLVVLSVGNDPASEVYVRNKVRACAEFDVSCIVHHLPSDIDQNTLNDKVSLWNEYNHGFILQLPLPEHLDANEAIKYISPYHDVDGLVKNALAIPCTPLGIMKILDKIYPEGIRGLDVVVIGRSDLVGKPVAKLLTDRDATVTLCHSKTKDLKKYTLTANVIIVAVGKPGFITPDMVRNGATVIDVGINRVGTKLVGDVDPSVAEKAYVTPVPGGVGKTTVASMMLNLAYLNEKRFR